MLITIIKKKTNNKKYIVSLILYLIDVDGVISVRKMTHLQFENKKGTIIDS